MSVGTGPLSSADPPQPESRPLDRGAVLAGARAILPLSIGVLAFGMAYGVAVGASSMDDLAGALASVIIIAGAAQLAMAGLIDDGAPWFVIVGTALIINARFVMYSGAVAPSFSEYPRRWRLPLSHLLTDQSMVTSLLFNERVRDPRLRMSFYVGAGASFAGAWVAGTLAGMFIGAAVPEQLQIGFAVPLMFIALLVPSVKDRASLVAAAFGFAVTLLAKDAPLNTGLLIGAFAGIAAGMIVRIRGNGGGTHAAAPSEDGAQSGAGVGEAS